MRCCSRMPLPLPLQCSLVLSGRTRARRKPKPPLLLLAAHRWCYASYIMIGARAMQSLEWMRHEREGERHADEHVARQK